VQGAAFCGILIYGSLPTYGMEESIPARRIYRCRITDMMDMNSVPVRTQEI
jgi:hypothetical protein